MAEVSGEKGAHREGVDRASSQAMRCGSVCVARPQAATCLQNHPPEHAVRVEQEDAAVGCPSRSACPRLPSCPHLSGCDRMPGVLHQPETEPTLPQMGGCQTLMLPISGDLRRAIAVRGWRVAPISYPVSSCWLHRLGAAQAPFPPGWWAHTNIIKLGHGRLTYGPDSSDHGDTGHRALNRAKLCAPSLFPMCEKG